MESNTNKNNNKAYRRRCVFMPWCRPKQTDEIELLADTIQLHRGEEVAKEQKVNSLESEIKKIEKEAVILLKAGKKDAAKRKLLEKKSKSAQINKLSEDITNSIVRRGQMEGLASSMVSRESMQAYVNTLRTIASNSGLNGVEKLTDDVTDIKTDMKEFDAKLDKLGQSMKTNSALEEEDIEHELQRLMNSNSDDEEEENREEEIVSVKTKVKPKKNIKIAPVQRNPNPDDGNGNGNGTTTQKKKIVKERVPLLE